MDKAYVPYPIPDDLKKRILKIITDNNLHIKYEFDIKAVSAYKNVNTNGYIHNSCHNCFTVYIAAPNASRDNILCHFELREYVNCCGVAVLTQMVNSMVTPKTGIGHIMCEWALRNAKAGGFGMVLATDTAVNEASYKILTKAGFTVVKDWFKNPRTLNSINQYYKLINQEEKDSDEDDD